MKLKKITIAFDVDGTLITENGEVYEDIRSLLVILSKFKNTRIIVWSGGGELYARQVTSRIGIDKYVDDWADKNHIGYDVINKKHDFEPDLKPDIAIDDIQACELGVQNLIVRNK